MAAPYEMGNSESSCARQLSVCDGKYDVCCTLKANIGGGECMSAKGHKRTFAERTHTFYKWLFATCVFRGLT